MNHFIPNELAMWAARMVLLLSLGAGLATAQTNSGNYTFLFGSGFLCDVSDASTCPTVAKAAQGDSYELSGAGTFNVDNKSVKAAGTYAHKSNNGRVLEQGVWTASELVTFVSYGIVTSVLNRRTGLPQLGPKRLLMISGPVPNGGLAVLRILLLPTWGASRTAVLEVNCAQGEVPHDRSVEGIRLNLDCNHGEFAEESGGRVLFLSMHPSSLGQ